jgi:hypothetical protein
VEHHDVVQMLFDLTVLMVVTIHDSHTLALPHDQMDVLPGVAFCIIKWTS